MAHDQIKKNHVEKREELSGCWKHSLNIPKPLLLTFIALSFMLKVDKRPWITLRIFLTGMEGIASV